jgi:hypothetical protein
MIMTGVLAKVLLVDSDPKSVKQRRLALPSRARLQGENVSSPYKRLYKVEMRHRWLSGIDPDAR